MYCPNCAANIDGVRFCRSCGANVSLVSQALTGQLPTGDRNGEGKSGRPPSIETAASSFFSGIGLFIAAFAALSFAPAGRIWWFWILIPALGSMGHGVGQYLRYRDQVRLRSTPPHPVSYPAVDTGQLPVSADEIAALPGAPSIPGGSIVEQTTLNLDRVKPVDLVKTEDKGE